MVLRHKGLHERLRKPTHASPAAALRARHSQTSQLVIEGGEDTTNYRSQQRNVCTRRLEHDRMLGVEVSMRKIIPHPRNICPWNLGFRRDQFRVKTFHRLAHFDQTNTNRVEQNSFVDSLSSHVTLYRTTCRKQVIQEVQRRAAHSSIASLSTWGAMSGFSELRTTRSTSRPRISWARPCMRSKENNPTARSMSMRRSMSLSCRSSRRATLPKTATLLTP